MGGGNLVDEIDLILLDLLQRDSRRSNAELAQAVGLSASSVYERVKKLEARGVITGYHAHVDAARLKRVLTAFIRVQVATDPYKYDEYLAQVARASADPDVMECHHVAGEDCLLFKVRVGGTADLERVLHRLRAMLPITRTVTEIVLTTWKESYLVEPAGVGGKDASSPRTES